MRGCRLLFSAFLFAGCGGSLVVPLHDEEALLVRHPGLKGHVVTVENYVPGKASPREERWSEKSHRLRPGDRIWLQVDTVDQKVAIAPQGEVDFPQIGVVSCSGRDIVEVREELRRRYAAVIRDPQVRLAVEVPDPTSGVWIVGMVSYEGRLELKQAEDLRKLFAMAGGLSRRACLPQILVVRPEEKKAIVCDYYRYARNQEESQNLRLRDGDIVVVTELYDPDRVPLAPEWDPIERFFLGTLERQKLIAALDK